VLEGPNFYMNSSMIERVSEGSMLEFFLKFYKRWVSKSFENYGMSLNSSRRCFSKETYDDKL